MEIEKQLENILNGFKSIEERDNSALELKGLLINSGVEHNYACNVATAWHQITLGDDTTELIDLIRNNKKVINVFTKYKNYRNKT